MLSAGKMGWQLVTNVTLKIKSARKCLNNHVSEHFTSAAVSNSLLSADSDVGADADNDCPGDVAAILRRAGENRRAAETVARHLLARLDNASTMVGMGPWDDYSHTARYH
jgi:hypothetical protein